LALLLLLALGVRIVFMNLDHPWDVGVWNGFFADLAHNVSPYETLENQTLDARSRYGVGHAIYYEGYAYPPLPIFIYYPLAKLYGTFYQLEHVNVTAGQLASAPVPWLFDFLFKLPIFLADIGIALLLYKMTKKNEKSMNMFLFNPYVIFISVWMFDSIAVFFLLLSLYFFERARYDLSAISLSLGFLTKFYPIFALPIFCLELIRRRSWRFLRYATIFGVVSMVFILPFLNGFTTSLSFQALRAPQGITPFSFALSGKLMDEQTGFQILYIIVPAIGIFALVTGMCLVYAHLAKKEISLRKKLLMTFLAYLIVMKVVNEAYSLVLIPLFILLFQEVDPSKRIRMYGGLVRTSYRILYHAIWIMPLTFAIFNTPITNFLGNFGVPVTLGPSTNNWFSPGLVVLGFLIIAFYITLWVSLLALKREKK